MAGETIFENHEENIKKVPILLKKIQSTLDEKIVHPVQVNAIFHKWFIYLHPFRDGNGRLGRLLSNFILAKNNEPLIIVEKEKKEKYIEALKASEKDMSSIISFFLTTSMGRMENEIAQKRRSLPEFSFTN